MKSTIHAASQLPGGGLLMWMMPLHLHVIQNVDTYVKYFQNRTRGSADMEWIQFCTCDLWLPALILTLKQGV